MTYDDFMSAKINGKYDTVNGKDIYNYVYKVSYDERGVNKIPDARFILDFGNIKDKWDAFYSLRYLFVNACTSSLASSNSLNIHVLSSTFSSRKGFKSIHSYL